MPSIHEIEEHIEGTSAPDRVAIDANDITEWDSGLLIFLTHVTHACAKRMIEVDREGLPGGIAKLLDLATAVPEVVARETPAHKGLLEQIGSRSIGAASSVHDVVRFVGEAILALLSFVRRKARYRRSDFLQTIQECGSQALPIVSLISLLIGLILAFVGAVQLQQFGAEIYVADLVGVGMTREMAIMMTGIIMAGRTGAAFAAQIGTMTVNEEVDALRTLGISPMEFLVLPRMLALAIMMPLLCLYADFVGILGGLIVGVGMLDLGFIQYCEQTANAVSLADVGVGLAKGVVFGILVAISGCLRGMQCGRSSAAVGTAATSAVVTAIVFIIVTDAIFAVLTHMLGI